MQLCGKCTHVSILPAIDHTSLSWYTLHVQSQGGGSENPYTSALMLAQAQVAVLCKDYEGFAGVICGNKMGREYRGQTINRMMIWGPFYAVYRVPKPFACVCIYIYITPPFKQCIESIGSTRFRASGFEDSGRPLG